MRQRGCCRGFAVGCLRCIAKAVAEAPDGANQQRIRWIGFNLLAQAKDVDVDRAVSYRSIVTPDCIEELLAAEHDAWPVHQEFEQPEFGGGQSQWSDPQPGFATGAVKFESGGL